MCMTVRLLFKDTPANISLTLILLRQTTLLLSSLLSSSDSLLMLPAPLPHRRDKVIYLIYYMLLYTY